jgi:hypothetical protein
VEALEVERNPQEISDNDRLGLKKAFWLAVFILSVASGAAEVLNFISHFQNLSQGIWQAVGYLLGAGLFGALCILTGMISFQKFQSPNSKLSRSQMVLWWSLFGGGIVLAIISTVILLIIYGMLIKDTDFHLDPQKTDTDTVYVSSQERMQILRQIQNDPSFQKMPTERKSEYLDMVLKKIDPQYARGDLNARESYIREVVLPVVGNNNSMKVTAIKPKETKEASNKALDEQSYIEETSIPDVVPLEPKMEMSGNGVESNVETAPEQ